MQILSGIRRRQEETTVHVTAIFGLGLVGHNISSNISILQNVDAQSLPFNWHSVPTRQQQIELIEATILQLSRTEAHKRRISIVWSAGAAGFSASQDVFDAELASFDLVLKLCRDLQERVEDTVIDFHLVSSAGGLFEGQRNVDSFSTPKPLRAYAEAKLAQETKLQGLPSEIVKHIYRPSTIYGYHPGGRPGLIITLFSNGYQRRTTRIFGSPDTLRDFIHVSDIGRFVAGKALAGVPIGGTFLMASGKPTNMRSIIGQVERVIRQPIYLQFDPCPSNAKDNTFRPSALTHLSTITPLNYGIKLSASQWFEKEFGQKQGLS